MSYFTEDIIDAVHNHYEGAGLVVCEDKVADYEAAIDNCNGNVMAVVLCALNGIGCDILSGKFENQDSISLFSTLATECNLIELARKRKEIRDFESWMSAPAYDKSKEKKKE